MSVFHALRTTSPRWRRRFAAVVGASLALVVATAAPAHAATGTLSDDFEAADAGQVWLAQDGTGNLVPANPDSHSPSHTGYLMNTRYGSWASLGRPVQLPALLGPRTTCKASIWIEPQSWWPVNFKVNIEVINPTDWTYISLRTLDLAPDSGWQQITSSIWTPYTWDVYFRISNLSYPGVPYGGGAAYLDDFRVVCIWT
jgi:hypothetical protein